MIVLLTSLEKVIHVPQIWILYNRLTGRPEMSEYFLAGFIEGGASMVQSK